MWRTLAWILPLQAAIFVALGLYRGTVALREHLPTCSASCSPRCWARCSLPVVLVMLQLPGGRPAQRAGALSHRAHLPDGAAAASPIACGRSIGCTARSRRWASPCSSSAPAKRARASRRTSRAAGSGASSGLLDDDPPKQGRVLCKVRVLGPIGELPRWCEKYGVRKVIIALPSANHVVRRRVAELCADAGVEALTVPSYEDLISGRPRAHHASATSSSTICSAATRSCSTARASRSGSATAW